MMEAVSPRFFPGLFPSAPAPRPWLLPKGFSSPAFPALLPPRAWRLRLRKVRPCHTSLAITDSRVARSSAPLHKTSFLPIPAHSRDAAHLAKAHARSHAKHMPVLHGHAAYHGHAVEMLESPQAGRPAHRFRRMKKSRETPPVPHFRALRHAAEWAHGKKRRPISPSTKTPRRSVAPA